MVRGTGQRFRCSMFSTITDRDPLAFMAFEDEFTVRVFLKFLKRPTRHVKQPIFLIVDRHPVRRAARVRR